MDLSAIVGNRAPSVDFTVRRHPYGSDCYRLVQAQPHGSGYVHNLLSITRSVLSAAFICYAKLFLRLFRGLDRCFKANLRFKAHGGALGA